MADTFKMDIDNIEKFEFDLKKFAARAYPFATKSTINQAAFHAQKRARGNVERNMVTRNKFSKQSIQVEMAKGLNVARQAAFVGSIADYMEVQEFGGTKRARGKQGIPLTTSYAAGQGLNAQPRTRLARKPNKLASIQLTKRKRKATTRKQATMIAIQQAAATGRKYVFLDLGRRKGIFKVIGGKRKPRIKMVHDLTHTSVRIPANPWLKPAVDQTTVIIPQFYVDALRFQLKRQGLFKG